MAMVLKSGRTSRKKAPCTSDQKTLSKIDTILKIYRGRLPQVVYRAILDAFPGRAPLYEVFSKAYRDGITPHELHEALFNPGAIKKHRPPKTTNKKFANRRDPFEVRRPEKKRGENWPGQYDHLTITCSDGIEGCRQFEKEPRAKWEQNGNFLHIMKGFYMRVDQLSKDREEKRKGIDEESLAVIDEMNPGENEIPIPLWMASAIADGFKQFVSRRLYDKDDKVTLDAIFRVDGKKPWKEFDPSIIDNSAILHKTRELQWYCGLAFSPALEYAYRIIKAECDCEGEEKEGNIFTLNHATLESLKDQEVRGQLPSLGAWLEYEGLAKRPPAHLTADFLEYIDILDRTIRSDIEANMKDGRKKIHP